MLTILWYLLCLLLPMTLWLWDPQVSVAASLTLVVLALVNLFVRIMPINQRHTFAGLTIAVVMFIVGPFLTLILVGNISMLSRLTM
jgi:hypothetical protein